jgi:GxxExxY protein
MSTKRQTQRIDDETDRVARGIVDAAFRVHKELGPGLLEGVYEKCLLRELRSRDFQASRQVYVPIIYRGEEVGTDLKLDLLVEDRVIVELKAVEILLPLHEAQLLTYLKIANRRLGLLINFNVPLIRDGIKRRIL